ncbi:hypothetical protein GCM10028791_32510 [Echinicola sediminis]
MYIKIIFLNKYIKNKARKPGKVLSLPGFSTPTKPKINYFSDTGIPVSSK